MPDAELLDLEIVLDSLFRSFIEIVDSPPAKELSIWVLMDVGGSL